MTKRIRSFRSAVTGRFVRAGEALRHPLTTVSERIARRRRVAPSSTHVVATNVRELVAALESLPGDARVFGPSVSPYGLVVVPQTDGSGVLVADSLKS